MSLGEVKPATDEDFARLKSMALETTGWISVYSTNNSFVWTKQNELSPFNMIKSKAYYSDVSADVLYDVLHDPLYRKVWDPTILEGREICKIDNNNDIGYYAMQLPKPLANRDFLTARAWKVQGKEMFIVNHSVNHASVPLRKSYIRGTSYMTGYYLVSDHDDTSQDGCTITYVTHSDPKGSLPAWVVNKASNYLAPKVIDKLHSASLAYKNWKLKNEPDNKPWLHPNQSSLPTVKSKDILDLEPDEQDDLTFESLVLEEDLATTELN